MAVLAIASETARMPMGPYWMKSFVVTTVTAGAQSDEWIVTGFTDIKAVVGSVITGPTEDIDTNCFLRNAEGTGAAATSGGSLGIQVGAALPIEVTVLGV